MKKKIILIKFWLMRKFGYQPERIRQAEQVVPGRIYDNFGHFIRAVPVTEQEREVIKVSGYVYPCVVCDLYIQGLPCPLVNKLPNGEEVCKNHKYEIIKV